MSFTRVKKKKEKEEEEEKERKKKKKRMKEKCVIFVRDMVTIKGSSLKVWGLVIIPDTLQHFLP